MLEGWGLRGWRPGRCCSGSNSTLANCCQRRFVVGADLPVCVELGARQRAGEVKHGILAIRLDDRRQLIQAGGVRDAGFGRDVEPGGDAEPMLDGINLLIEHIQEPGRPEQIPRVGELPAAGQPMQGVGGAVEEHRALEGDVVHRRARHHDDVERLDVVVLKELLLPFDVVELVEERKLLRRAGNGSTATRCS